MSRFIDHSGDVLSALREAKQAALTAMGTEAVSMIVLEALCRQGLAQGDLAVALGGRNVQGAAGLAAAIYQGGIELAACPSTAQAQLCACGGELLGVELARPGCRAGVYKAPALIMVDPALPETEPAARRAAGYAWALQIALTCDPKLLALLEAAEPDSQGSF